MNTRPYLIIPKLIEQPTWGGTYILQLKNWLEKPFLKNKKIGQSYELFGDSKLAINITDTDDITFVPEFGFADKPETVKDHFNLKEHNDYITLSHLVKEHEDKIVGPTILKTYGTMPLLIKLNQAAGNSFQLHVKPGTQHARWKPKPESWYYLEDGLVTCGIKDEKNMSEYKAVCVAIEEMMQQLSNKIKTSEITLEQARIQAKDFIKNKNPWQFVNIHEVKKHDLIDLSMGGVHHSWEENKETHPLGNIVYEVQLDVMDPLCTIRSFDQGKFKEDGSIREIHIDDYFHFLDTTQENNDIHTLKKTRQGEQLLKTPFYSVDIFEIEDTKQDTTAESFVHLYVRDGDVDVITKGGNLHVTKGHSCFLPQAIGEYEIKNKVDTSVVLKTFIQG